MKFCGNCGNKNSENDSFCSKCGSKIKTGTKKTTLIQKRKKAKPNVFLFFVGLILEFSYIKYMKKNSIKQPGTPPLF